jgi:hypothetical protein
LAKDEQIFNVRGKPCCRQDRDQLALERKGRVKQEEAESTTSARQWGLSSRK